MAHKVSARVHALTLGGSGERTLPTMESHGKRLDKSSMARRVSDRAPVVYRSLDLRAEYDRHVDGAKMNAGLGKPALHMLLKFPEACLVDGPETPAPYRSLPELARKELMMRQAVAFANRCYGGNAVFAGRVDRDEAGELNVDLFLSPRYEKVTKTGKRSEWISTTKHGKELAEKHLAAIKPRVGSAKIGPRAVGIALQEELAAFHREVNGIETTRQPKDGAGSDWRAVEDWKRSQAAQAAQEAAEAQAARMVAEAEREAAAVRAETEAARAKAEAEEKAEMTRQADVEAQMHAWLNAERAEIAKRRAQIDADALALEAVAQALGDGSLRETVEGDLQMHNPEQVKAAPGIWHRIFPAVREMIGLRRAAEADRLAAHADRLAAAECLAQAQADRSKLRSLATKVSLWLFKPDLTVEQREVGREFVKEVHLKERAPRAEESEGETPSISPQG